MEKRRKKYIKKQNKINIKTRKKIPVLKLLFFLSFLIMSFVLVLKNTDNVQNIFTKKNKIKVPQETNLDKLEIGDIVYYNHKDVIKLKSEDPAMQEKYNKMQKDHEANQTVTIPGGDSKTPGSGDGTADLSCNAKYYNTTWRIWDKLPDGRIMLVSNRAVAGMYAKAAVGHIWWEHNAHKISSIFGYGEGADVGITDTGEEVGANKGFPYKVGSGIDDAPDMNEGDKGDWKIGEEPQDKINISAARSLTLPEVEKKLGITDASIKNKTTSTYINSSPGYGNQTTTSMTYVVQRDINSPNQDWSGRDRSKGKAKNKSYKMTDRYYYWGQNSIPETKYKKILFNGINDINGLATNALTVDLNRKVVRFGRGVIIGNVGLAALNSSSHTLVNSGDSGWREYGDSLSLRVAVYLKSKIKYLPAGDNTWDIYEASSEDKDLKLKVLNLSSEPASKIGLEVVKAKAAGVAPEDAASRLMTREEVDGKIEYIVKAKKFDGQKRDENTTGDNAKFSRIDNKYNVTITGIPEGYDFKIIGKTGKQIDLDTDTNLEYELVIYPKAGTQNVQVEYKGGDNYFSVTGNVVIKYDGKELGRTNGVTLKRGVNSVPVDNVDLFDQTDNSIKEYTVEFERSEDDKTLHTVAFDPDTKKLVVTYVSPKKEITISVAEDSKKYLTNITEIKLKLVGDGKETPVTLKPDENKNFDTKLTVSERDEDGNPINYSLQKVENIPGYYVSIDGFNVNLKPILKLPFTGTELSGKNIAILGFSILGVALAFRFRKKIVLIFKEYAIMK